MTNPQNQWQQPPQGNPGGYPPQQPPPKKKGGCMKWALIIIGVIIAIAVIAAIASSGGDDTGNGGGETGQQDQAPAGNGGHTLRWEFETSDGSPANVTWMGENMNMSQNQGAPSGWSQEVTAESKWDLLGANMNAQNQGSGDITCRVFWDGELVNENTSSGQFAVVSCSLPN